MLDELHVKNIALIEEAYISFSPGMTVLTGETGAGKTALLSALKGISGARADSKTVRMGAEEALAEARIVHDGEELVASRRLSSQGRSRCMLNGEMATVGQLASACQWLRVHNQHEQVLLLSPATQLAYLDDSISPQGLHLASYRAALKEYLGIQEELSALEEAAKTESAQIDYLTFVLNQIEEVSPCPGEYEELEAEIPRLQHAAALANAAQGAYEALNGDGCALDMLGSASNEAYRTSGVDPELDRLIERLDEIQELGSDLVRDLRSYRDSIRHDPQSLNRAQERISQLKGLMRRYGPGMEQVFATWEQTKETLGRVQASPQRMDKVRSSLAKARKALEHEAFELDKRRSSAAESFCKQLGSSVAELAMPSASFSFEFSKLPFEKWGANGPSRVELLFSPASAAKPQPLAKIASGGELSRILLALECVHALSAGAADVTLVFDEVDSGIGGAVGEAVGLRLAQLARSAQVIVITHLPQVAAHADSHYVVQKLEHEDGLPATVVSEVKGEDRVSEIARMLAGREDETALSHARTLLAEARGRA